MDDYAYYQQNKNVEQIRSQGTRIIRGPIPRQVRKELMAAVKRGCLGRLKKDGLKPEVFYKPDHKYLAQDLQLKEAKYAIGLISKVMVSSKDLTKEQLEADMGNRF